jgi:SEC-C motif domain protein
MTKCSCGNEKSYEECCSKFISGKAIPQTAVEMMKSRYTAYTVHDIEYIMNTHEPARLSEISRDVLSNWATTSKWISLEILKTEKGEKTDSEGIVEFIANYELHGAMHSHHEKSLFKKIDGKWFYSESMPLDATRKNENKVGRNDPCVCGSGKKSKKCCG